MSDPLQQRHLDRSAQHRPIRAFLRVVGPLVLIAGIACIVIAFIDFVQTVNSPVFGARATRFWLFFLGGPLLFVGAVMTGSGYMGAVARYQANEMLPVAKDGVNYMAHGTQEGVRTATRAVAQGLREGLGDQPLMGGASGRSQTVIRCHKCNADNDADAKFCDNCGAALAKSVSCPNCNELNDPDAKFCDNCGKALA